MFFKLDHINNLTSARWAAATGFTHLTFDFEKTSEFYCSPMMVSEIKPWIVGCQLGGRFTLNEVEFVLDIIQLLTLDFIEMDRALFLKLSEKLEVPVFLRVANETWVELQKLQNEYPIIKAFILNSETNSFGEDTVNQCIVPSTQSVNFIKHIPYGVSFSPEQESESGVFDFDNLDLEFNRWSLPQ